MERFLTSEAASANPIAFLPKVLRVVGMWPIISASNLKTRLYNIYSGIVVTSFAVQFVAGIMFCVKEPDIQLNDITFTIFVALGMLICLSATLTFITGKQTLLKLYKMLDDDFNNYPSQLRAKWSSRYHKLSISIVTVWPSWGLLFVMTPLITAAFEGGEVIASNSTSSKRRLPLNSWYPFTVTSSPTFEIMYIFQSVTTVIGIVPVSIFSAIFLSLSMFIMEQFELLNFSLREIKAVIFDTVSCAQTPASYLSLRMYKQESTNNVQISQTENKSEGRGLANSNFSNISNSMHKSMGVITEEKIILQESNCLCVNQDSDPAYIKQNGDEVQNRLRNCILHHIVILKFAAQFDSLMSNSMFIQLLSTTLMFTMIAFEASTGMVIDANIVSLLAFLLMSLANTFIFGWLGSNIATKSCSVGEAAYDSGWELTSPSVKRSVCIIIARSQEAAILTGSKFYVVNLETYLALLNMAFSYFMVLRSVATS